MNWIDFLIGFLLMNAMPHFVLGTWKARMFSGFGFGHRQNIAYSALNFLIAGSLFLYTYGWEGLWDHGIFVGAIVMMIIYYSTGWFWVRLFHKPEME